MLLGLFHWHRLDMGYVLTFIFLLFYFFFFESALHWLLGEAATFLWLVADFSSPPFLKRFQIIFSNKTVTVATIYPKQLFIVHWSTLLFSKLVRSLVEPSGYINCKKCLALKNYFKQGAQKSKHLQSSGINKLRATDSSIFPDFP